MFNSYPKYIPESGVEYDVAGVKEIKVQTEAEHKAKNLDHYESERASQPLPAATVSEELAKERNRCAMIAERFPGGLEIATAIRSVPPTIKEVLDAGGFTATEARQIVADETRKYNAGEPPYGPHPEPAAPVSVPAAPVAAVAKAVAEPEKVAV